MIALSLLGYLLFGLVGRSHIQYYNLQACKKVSITMLVASIFSIAATVGLYFICKASKIPFAVEINYGNIVTTVLLCVFMIVVTSLPWSIYKMLYRHHYMVYQKSEGGN